MGGENVSESRQSPLAADPKLIVSSNIPSRDFVEKHLDSQRPVRVNPSDPSQQTILKSQDPKAKEALVSEVQKQQQEVNRPKQDATQQFAKQEAETVVKITIAEKKLAELKSSLRSWEAAYQEYKDSWKFWRGWTSEEDEKLHEIDSVKKAIAAQEVKLAEIVKQQAEFKKLKEEYLNVIANPPSADHPVSAGRSREAIFERLRARSESLNNLVALDMMALKAYEERNKDFVPRNAWEKFRDSTYDAFSKTKVGRFVIGVVTVAGKVVGAVADAVVGVVKFVADPENWKKAWDGIVWSCKKLGEGLEWLGDKLQKGFDAAWNFASKWENWKNLGSAIATGISKAWDFITTGDNWNKMFNAIGNGLSAACKFIGNGLSKAWDFVTDPENWRKLGNAIANGISSAWDFVTDPKNWAKLGNAILSGLSKAWDFITSPEKWIDALVAIGKGIGNAVYYLGKGLLKTVEILGKFLVDPNAAWDDLCNHIDAGMTYLTEALGIPAVWNGTKKVLGFIKGMADELGITSIIAGAANIITMPTRLAYQSVVALGKTCAQIYNFTMGNCSFEEMSKGFSNIADSFNANIKEGFAQSTRLVSGVYRLAIECTGIAGMGRALYYAAQGDWVQAGIEFGLAIADMTALALTIVTGGAGIAAYAGIMAIKRGLRASMLKLANKCLKVVGHELGEKIGADFTEKVGIDVLVRRGASLADNLVEELSKKGLSLDTIRAATKDLTGPQLEKFLTEHGLGDMVDKRVRKTLQAIIDNPSPKNLQKVLSRSPEMAALTKQELKAARKMLESGKDFDAVTNILTRQITGSIKDKIGPHIEKGFAERLEASLAGKVNTEAAQKLATQVEKEALEKGIPKEQLIKQYVDEARIGLREALHEAIEKIVRKAVRKALRHLRFHEDSNSAGWAEKDIAKERKEQKVLAKLEASLGKLEAKLASPASGKKIVDSPFVGHTKQTRTERGKSGATSYVARYEKVDDGDWVESGRTITGEDKPSNVVTPFVPDRLENAAAKNKKEKQAA